MTDTPTPNIGFTEQSYGSNIGLWGAVTDSNWDIADKQLGGTLTKDVHGDQNVTITEAESLYSYQVLTGELTGNIEYIVPAKGRRYIISNQTTGSYTVTIRPYGAITSIITSSGDTLFVVVASSQSIVSITQVFPPVAPLPIHLGGTGTSTVPAAGQILVGNVGGTSYVPQTVSGDASLLSSGVITVSKIGGQAIGLAGPFSTVGAYSLTLTVTAITNATFPPGIVTLASTDDITQRSFRTVTAASSSAERTLSASDWGCAVWFDTSGGDITFKAPLGVVPVNKYIKTDVLMSVGGGVVDFVTDFANPVTTRFGGLVNVNDNGNGEGGKIILTDSAAKFVGNA